MTAARWALGIAIAWILGAANPVGSVVVPILLVLVVGGLLALPGMIRRELEGR